MVQERLSSIFFFPTFHQRKSHSHTTSPYIKHHHSSHALSVIMTTTSPYYQYQYQPTGSLPVNVPGKQPQQPYAPYAPRHNRNSSGYSQYSASPPERPESVSTSGAGLYSSASSQYAGSEYDSSSGATSVDLLDYMNDRLSRTYDPTPLDKNLAKQAQM